MSNDRRAFGWDYPMGSENDPRAPWNQSDPVCEECWQVTDECECGLCPQCGRMGCGACPDCDD